jgi:hypothetical protein
MIAMPDGFRSSPMTAGKYAAAFLVAALIGAGAAGAGAVKLENMAPSSEDLEKMDIEEADAALTIEVTDKLTAKTQTVSLAVGELKTINLSEDPKGLVHYSMVPSFRGNTCSWRFDHDGKQHARPVRFQLKSKSPTQCMAQWQSGPIEPATDAALKPALPGGVMPSVTTPAPPAGAAPADGIRLGNLAPTDEDLDRMSLQAGDTVLTIDVTDKETTKTETVSLAEGEFKTVSFSEDAKGFVHFSLVPSFRGNKCSGRNDFTMQHGRTVRVELISTNPLQCRVHF